MVVTDKSKSKDKEKLIDPNVLVNQYYKTGTKEKIEVARGIKKFEGNCDFTFYFVTDPKASLLSQPEDPNFCIGSISFKYGKDKEAITFMSFGPSPRVLDAVLSQVDKYYHEDIVDWHSSKKLSYIADKVKKDDAEDSKKKLKQGMDAILEGFKKRREVTGKPAPQFFKAKDEKMLDEVKEWNKKLVQNKQYEKLFNPFMFKSAKTKEAIDEGIYKYLTPAEILTQRLAQTGVSAPQLASACKFDISTVYNHLRGTRDVDRKAALRYAKFFSCDPADILFPPIKINLTGTCDLIQANGVVKINYDKEKDKVLCPRDFYSNSRDIKSIQITSPNSVYHDHVAYYYYTNKKETDCENKICFIGVTEHVAGEDLKSYYIGIYENYRGRTRILNADPYRSKETILEDPQIDFITPIIAFVNVSKVKFSPIENLKIKKISENEKLIKLEKQLELAEQQWWIENQKLSGKQVTSKGKGQFLEKMYKDLRDTRLEVDQLRRKIMLTDIETTKDDDMLKRMHEYMEELKIDWQSDLIVNKRA